MSTEQSFVLDNTFLQSPVETEPVTTPFRRIQTPLPGPRSQSILAETVRLMPRVSCYQPAIAWDRAEGFQVYDGDGNCWIDFSSTAVMTNTGHGHPRIRAAVAEHARHGMLAQFSFASKIRTELAARLLALAPNGMDKVYFWTTGSEANECAFRLCRQRGLREDSDKHHLLCIRGDYHGCTLGAHQLSGEDRKPWLKHDDPSIHRIPVPTDEALAESGAADWDDWLTRSLRDAGVSPATICGVFVETIQGWGAMVMPTESVHALRRFADEHNAMLVFDEVQTGFGRTGKLFGHEHYDVRADMLCIGKGISSSLPLAAVLGPAEVLDLQSPGEVTSTHAGHPLACAAALANLDVLEEEDLVGRAAALGEVARRELNALRERFPDAVSKVCGQGLLNAIHVRNPATGLPDYHWASDLAWNSVLRGVMVFRTLKPTLKIVPPLVISEEALIDGVAAIGEALERSV